ncbi:MAG: T9SS type A sorting domain-containing protein [Bacteroidetes bacterium]|nr:T9SS type A sorting domain-containing protein [Bacteroidota bacterium]
MKKSTLLCTGALLILITVLKAQSISNAGFEDWTYHSYFEEPDMFTTTNPYLVLAGEQPNVTKTSDAHSGNYALRLETTNTPDEPIFGAAFIGQVSDTSFAGGIPFTQRPDSVSGYAKYNLQIGDTAFMAVLFKKFGAPLGICSLAFVGSQNTYQYFSAPVNWFVPIVSPDSLVAGFISSSFENIPIAGSTIIFDDISFVGVGASFPNGDFEDWNEIGADEPDDWTTSNLLTASVSGAGVTKSTDSHSGSFAVQLESVISFNGDSICLLTNGALDEEVGPIGGMPVFEFPKMVSGYYKYSPVGLDTALAGLWLYHYDAGTGVTETLQETVIRLPPVSDYTYFELPVLYYNVPVPDTINIAFAPSNYEGTFIGLGSTLLVDDLEITYQPFVTGTNENINQQPIVYPNPAHRQVNLNLKGWLDQELTITVTDITGQTVYYHHQASLSGNNLSMDVGEFDPGLYFYSINCKDQTVSGKFIVE